MLTLFDELPSQNAYWSIAQGSGRARRSLARHGFLTDAGYAIADIAVFAHVHRADEADLPLPRFAHLAAWIERVRAQPNFLDRVHPYGADPHSGRELP